MGGTDTTKGVSTARLHSMYVQLKSNYTERLHNMCVQLKETCHNYTWISLGITSLNLSCTSIVIKLV